MIDFFGRIFDASDFVRRWECGNWSRELGWLHISADLGIWSAYLAIPCVLIFFIVRKRTLPFRSIFLLFGAFILLCGTTHLMDAIMFWWPGYRLAGGIKVLTALVSWGTVLALVRVTPQFLAMRTPRDLEQEIAARLKAEADLQEANAVLEERVRERTRELTEADRRKDEFLAMLAHELRNPMATIRNALGILRRGGPQQYPALGDMLDRQANQLVRLVDDLLDVSRVKRGKLELRTETLDLGRVIAGAAEANRTLAEAAKVSLTVAPPAEPLVVAGDPARLEQVVANLIHNATKYTPDGGRIDVSAEREGGEAVVRIRDTGIGIAPERLPNVFDMFVKLDPAPARAQGGLGIGLTLVKSLIEMHGGTVTAASDGVGKGSEFTMRLPLARDVASLPAPAEPSSRIGPRPSRRVLVVDDNTDSADSLAALLELLGHEVRTAHDGPSALAAVDSFAPDVILLDIGLPGMNGYEVARQLRRRPEFEKTVLVAQTGWGQEEDRRRSREAGFDHHLVKPIDLAALEEILGAPVKG